MNKYLESEDCCIKMTIFPLLGNFKKAKQLLHKALECGAVPLQMLEIAIQNLNLQKKQLLSEEEKKSLSGKCIIVC